MKTKLSLILAFSLAATLALGAATVRIVQTNAAGDSVMLIDPVTNKVVGEIKGIEVNHGAAVAPDGSKFYITNEAESTLDVADAKTLAVTKHIPLTNHPNNVAVSKDGKRVYVAIVAGAGAVDVIDTTTLTRVKSIRTEGGIHNTYVTPDGKFVVAGSIPGRKINVIDQKTEEIVWTMPTDEGVRPMAFDTNPDGSIVLLYLALFMFTYDYPVLVYCGVVAGMPLLLAGLTAKTSFTAKVMTSRPVLWLGLYSYSIFMSHALAIKFIKVLLPTEHFVNSPLYVRLSVALAYKIAVICFAWALYRCVERPCKKFLKDFRSKRCVADS